MVSSESPLEQKSQCPQFTFLTDSANLPWKRMSASLKFFPRQKEYLKATGCTPLQYSCLESPMDGGAWWAAVHGVTKSQTRLRDFPFTFHFHALEKEMATHSSVLPGESQGRGSLVGCHLWGRTESGTTEAT